MHPSQQLLLVVLVAAGAARAHGSAAAGTPAARFWEEALPGTPMPPTIAELVKRGTDRSPLKEASSAPYLLPSACLGYSYRITCAPPAAARAHSAGVFFRHDDLRVGAVMTVHFPPVDLPAILPRADAERAPFANATAVLAAFGIAPGSAEGAMVRGTLRACQAPALAGEHKACATTLEGTVQTAMRMLGTARVSVAASAVPPREGVPRQPYAVAAVAPLPGGRHVTCHDDAFPYAVFRCHMEKEASTEAYKVTLAGLHGGGPVVDMVAVCHLDTTNWSADHPAFGILNLRPGGAPVCHFMPYADLLFAEKKCCL